MHSALDTKAYRKSSEEWSWEVLFGSEVNDSRTALVTALFPVASRPCMTMLLLGAARIYVSSPINVCPEGLCFGKGFLQRAKLLESVFAGPCMDNESILRISPAHLAGKRGLPFHSVFFRATIGRVDS
jgi:hypothetical protein